MDEPIITPETSLRETMRIIDESAKRAAVMLNENEEVVGIITDGDIRRALLKGAAFNEEVYDYATREFISVPKGTSKELIHQKMRTLDILQIPEIDKDGKLVKLHLYLELEEEETEVAVKKVLVIGGAGYVGHHVIDHLLENNFEVRCLDLNLYPEDQGIKHKIHDKRVEYVIGDMRNIPTLVKVLKDIDAVVHLAAIVGDPASKENPEAAITTNYLSSSLLATTCKYLQINRFVFISTCSVYGQGDEILDEGSNLQPVSLYGRNKVEAEKAILQLTDKNFRPTILRFGTIFGTSGRMRFDLVVNILTAKAVQEGKIKIFGGDQWRPLVHVRDAARAVSLVLSQPISKVGSQIFNVGCNSQNYQIKDLVPFFKEIFEDLKIDILLEDTDARDYRVNFDKIKNLGFDCTIDIPSAIKEIKKYIERYNIDYSNDIFSNVKRLKKIQHQLH